MEKQYTKSGYILIENNRFEAHCNKEDIPLSYVIERIETIPFVQSKACKKGFGEGIIYGRTR